MPSPVTPPPPISTSSLPPSARPFRIPGPPMVVKPPILASDILREEIAPRRPAKRAIRVSLLAFAATFAIGAAAAKVGLGPIRLDAPFAFEGSLGTAVVAGLAAVAPLSYATRAWLAAVAGIVPLAMAALHLGPLAPLGDDGTLATLAFAVMATLLPAALVFRARYRAFPGARTVLAVALAASLPAVALLAMQALDGGVDLGVRVISGVAVGVATASTLGFMGPETSAGCTQWAALVVGALAARAGWRAGLAAWAGHDVEMIGATAAAFGELIASTLATFGFFQLLAAALGGQARQVDVHVAVGAGASEPSAPPD